MTDNDTDKSYAEASAVAAGRQYADFMKGCIQGGMTREEALETTTTYIHAVMFAAATSGPPPTTDD